MSCTARYNYTRDDKETFGQCALSEPALGGRDGQTCLLENMEVFSPTKTLHQLVSLISLSSPVKSVHVLNSTTVVSDCN